MQNKARTELLRTIIRQYPTMPKQTIARHILYHHGHMFDNNLENIRSAIRYYCGKTGIKNISKLGDRVIEHQDKIELPQSWVVHVDPYIMPPGKILTLADVHIPQHEMKPLETAIRAGKDEKVDIIFLDGDTWEGNCVGFWPSKKRDFDKEILALIDFLDFLIQEFPYARIIYKPGNHEYRMPRYFVGKAPELALSPLAQMETIMGFEARGIEFLDYHQRINIGKLIALHGHEVPNLQNTVSPARGLFLKTLTSSLCGHVHKSTFYPDRDINDKMIGCWTVGCLCNLHPEYAPYGRNWNWGYAIIDLEKDGNFEVRNYRILNNGKDVVL